MLGTRVIIFSGHFFYTWLNLLITTVNLILAWKKAREILLKNLLKELEENLGQDIIWKRKKK